MNIQLRIGRFLLCFLVINILFVHPPVYTFASGELDGLEENLMNRSGEGLTEENPLLGNPMQLFFRFIVSSVAIIALIYFFLKFLAKKQKQLQQHQLFQNLGGVTLGQNKSIQLVKMGDKLFVVGVGDQITLLQIIEEPGQVAALIEETDVQSSITTPDWLAKWLPKREQQGEGDAYQGEQSFRTLFERSLGAQSSQRSQLMVDLSQQSDQAPHTKHKEG